MKKILALAIALCVLLMSGSALAEVSFMGNVVARETVGVKAPFGGTIEKSYVRVGSLISVGDRVATIGTTRVYAAGEGTVCGVFGEEGDSAESVTTRYGGVMYIEPTNKYVVSATTEKAYNSSETKYIRVGEKVYLSCTKDGSHTGTAMVTSVKEADESGNTAYTLEVTGGEFYMGETVAVFRSKDYASNSCIGRGNIAQNAALPVAGTGSILKLHAAVGDQVERGQLLFETVDGVLDGLYAMDNTVVSDVAGVVASSDAAVGGSAVKGGNLITVYPRDAFQIQMSVSELDLSEIHEGSKVFIEFEWDSQSIRRYRGQVEEISYLNTTGLDGLSSGSVSYTAYVSFTPDESVRLGMSVIVYVVDEETWQNAKDVVDVTPAMEDGTAETADQE